jgi:hypothetical protein
MLKFIQEETENLNRHKSSKETESIINIFLKLKALGQDEFLSS